MQVSDFYIGQRLSVDGQLCTVRYHGQVAGTKGTWVGVEWDDHTRGKNSGDHLGARYFTCLSRSATAGSFIRPTRQFDQPRSFVDALRTKYASEAVHDASVESADSALSKKSVIKISGKEAEEVGFDKIRKQLANFQALKYVILDGLCIENPPARLRQDENVLYTEAHQALKEEIKRTCPNITELDVSRNLFEEWNEIVQFCSQLERLTSLRVNGNRFRDTSLSPTGETDAQAVFARITTLGLEDSLLQWEQVASLTHQFVHLKKLVVSNNAYISLTSHIPRSTMTEVVLEDNCITSFSDLHPLSQLPSLRRLLLNRNSIAKVTSSGDLLPPKFATTLYHVELAWNNISTWSLIDALPTIFPGLTSLRTSHNPLYETITAPDGHALSADIGYTLTTARLGSLQKLDFSEIKAKDRNEAELYYLNTIIAKELSLNPEDRQEHILGAHPRWKELCEEYGEPAIRRKISQSEVEPNSLAARLIKFTFHVIQDKQRGPPVPMEIPMSITTYTLIGLVARKFGLDTTRCRLIYETGDWIPKPRTEGAEEEIWSSDSSDDEGAESQGRDRATSKEDMVMREVEIVPGTRPISTWIDGMQAVVRIEDRGLLHVHTIDMGR
ncbi:tubulin-specific chaperone E [Lophiostoma macrostomum CBS 122681]|uniref:Tubulin-specific chaperone E n=1 Tax=Lophiostoma macrostomum CBS 122681 TaxID=1314788 RepID=A0A6A6T9H9_9PLEO|nr:tubulin-specific chaperone E [Lophiostoma macrostomum CBS 122681]